MGVVSIISLLASISAMVFAGPRVYYAMARDGMFFPAAARVHPRFRTPATSIVAQGLWSSVLVLSGSATALTTYTGFSIILFNGVAVAALFVLRQREPKPRARTPPGAIRWCPASSWRSARSSSPTRCGPTCSAPLTSGRPMGPSAAGLLIIALGLPLYAGSTRPRRRRADTAAAVAYNERPARPAGRCRSSGS